MTGFEDCSLKINATIVSFQNEEIMPKKGRLVKVSSGKFHKSHTDALIFCNFEDWQRCIAFRNQCISRKIDKVAKKSIKVSFIGTRADAGIKFWFERDKQSSLS